MDISVIIPVLNDAPHLQQLLPQLDSMKGWKEIVVVDGGSSDETRRVAARHAVRLVRSEPGRGVQMNTGVRHASGEILFFLHADTSVPSDAPNLITRALSDPSIAGGCFRLDFDQSHPLLRFASFCTRFPVPFIHYGDSGFFVRRTDFNRLGGYRPFPIMEDLDFWLRLRRSYRVRIVNASVTTSARRFVEKGVARQQLHSAGLVFRFLAGADHDDLAREYYEGDERGETRALQSLQRET